MNIQSKFMIPSTPAVLPDDLIIEVFSFLPVKSLIRFRCLNKFWKTLISKPTFVKIHLNRSSSRNPLFTLITQRLTHIAGQYDGDEGCLEMDSSVVPYSLNHLIDNPSFTLLVDPYYHLSDKNCSLMVGTCNGLILLAGSDSHSQLVYFRLWNPATMTTSPNFGYFRRFHSFNFGCDNSTGTYKIVASRYNPNGQPRSKVRILSYGDNVWREIQSFPIVPIRFYLGGSDVHDAVYLNSTLNWLAIHNYNDFPYNFKDVAAEQFVIVSLHLGTETYNQYRLPRDFDEAPPILPIVGVLGGCLCFSYFYKETDFLIWQMKELGVEDSWTQFLKINYQNLQRDYDYFSDEEFSDDETKYHFQLVPMLLSEDADTLVLKSSKKSHPILFNWRENRVEQAKITTSSTITNNRTSNSIVWCSNSILWSSAKVYLESLVSIF